jgi:LemA protein
MKLLKVLGGIGVLFVVGLVLVGGCIYRGYNTAISLDEQVKGQWAQVENQLQRRFELIPNVVETVKGVAGQEEKIYLGVAEARTKYFQAGSVAEKAEAAGGFERALSRLLVLQEQYPELKSNEAFMKLQDTVEGTENRLSVERQRFNEKVQQLNTYVRGPLGRLYASIAGVEKAEYFESPEEAATAPKIDFSPEPKGG